MTATNDITGDKLVSKYSSKYYENYDTIFGEKITLPKCKSKYIFRSYSQDDLEEYSAILVTLDKFLVKYSVAIDNLGKEDKIRVLIEEQEIKVKGDYSELTYTLRQFFKVDD